MRHRVATKKLGMMTAHRKAVLRNMMISLFKHERIRTTKQKAKVLRSIAEKAITRAKVDNLHNRRIIAKKIHDKPVLDKLFKVIAPRFAERNGGYTRILKLRQRITDAADMVFIELVDRKEKAAKSKKKTVEKETEKKAPAKEAAAKKPAVKSEAKKTPAKKSAGAKDVRTASLKNEKTEEKTEEKAAKKPKEKTVEKTVVKDTPKTKAKKAAAEEKKA
ncbi:MAG: 50S ribosomal protein L17 [Spirochaetales bacterium]|nr:50S ribosomal protein L17 [Spirochaetales bacterium]